MRSLSPSQVARPGPSTLAWEAVVVLEDAGSMVGDGKWILFITDRDGWDHLYVMPISGSGASSTSGAIQITKGNFEAWRPQWSPDSSRIAFDAR